MKYLKYFAFWSVAFYLIGWHENLSDLIHSWAADTLDLGKSLVLHLANALIAFLGGLALMAPVLVRRRESISSRELIILAIPPAVLLLLPALYTSGIIDWLLPLFCSPFLPPFYQLVELGYSPLPGVMLGLLLGLALIMNHNKG